MARRKPDGAGFLTNRIKAKLNTPPDGPWMPISREMLRTGAMRALSLHARRALDRIMVEHMDHAGQENGRLKVTWQDFEKFGVHRSFIKQALGELAAVGLVQSSSPAEGRGGRTEGDPTQYRLTHLPVCEPDNFRPATNEWKRFEEDITAAKSAIKAALPKQPSKPNGKVKHTWKAPRRVGRSGAAFSCFMGGGSVLAEATEIPLEAMGGVDSVCPRNNL